jgi:hypothetical protein
MQDLIPKTDYHPLSVVRTAQLPLKQQKPAQNSASEAKQAEENCQEDK